MKKPIFYVALLALILVGAVLADRMYLRRARGGAAPASSSTLPVAPDFAAADLNGKRVSLADHKGKVVLVNFWATFCGPCKVEMPWLIEFQQKYGERGLVVLGLSMDPEGKSVIEPWLAEQPQDEAGRRIAVNYPILLGNDDIAEKYTVFGLPTTLVVNREGRIVMRFVGLVSHEKFVKVIEANL